MPATQTTMTNLDWYDLGRRDERATLMRLQATGIGHAQEAPRTEPIAARRGSVSRRRRGTPTTVNLASGRVKRIPNWLREQTGLGTKKALMQRYGANARFVQGGALPPQLTVSAAAIKAAGKGKSRAKTAQPEQQAAAH